MTEHLTDEQLAGYRALDFLATNRTDLDRASAAVAATRALVREVDRLRAALEQARARISAVEQARCWTNEDGHDTAPAVADKPSRFTATPAQIDAFLRQHFAEDRIQPYQWAIGDRAAHEAAEEIRTDTGLRVTEGQTGLAGYGRELADLVDPAKGGGHFPAELVVFPAVAAGVEQ